MIKFEYRNIEIKNLCPCGKEMVPSNETTGGWKCSDRGCWVIYHKKEVWVGRPVIFQEQKTYDNL